jgi:histidine triad (HIT) family protein
MASLFTRIINREIPADIVYEDDHVVAFRDLNPQAPVHVLIVPREEVKGVADLPLIGDHQHLLNAAKTIAEQMGLADSGYRLVINQGEDAGQTVSHLHVHLLGGREFGWPPG